MSYKHIKKVNQYPCIDLLSGKIFPAIEPAGGGASGRFTTQHRLILETSTPNGQYISHDRYWATYLQGIILKRSKM